jgi:nicotinate-nucleotide pyrophosphorylase (carboxylating)
MLPAGVKTLIALALEEDLGRGDITGEGVPESAKAEARLVAKEDCIASCLFLAEAVLAAANIDSETTVHVRDGDVIKKGTTIITLKGSARGLLAAERTLLNFLQRSFGIATLASAIRRKVSDFPVKITDTRKTLPGFRYLDKRSVRDGGLFNHRFGLDGGVLVKENHIRAAGGIRPIVKTLKAQIPHGIKIEVEVTNRAEAFEAIEAGAEALLLDNFSPKDLAVLVKELKQKVPSILLEASGGISPDNVQEYAATGVDLISMGALTHSVRAADLSLLFEFSK